MISRRNFLIGIGGLVTTSFLARARTHLRQAGAPLLLEPKKAEENSLSLRGAYGARWDMGREVSDHAGSDR